MLSKASRGMFWPAVSQKPTTRLAIGAVMRRASSMRVFEHSTSTRDILWKSAAAASDAMAPAPKTMRTGSEW